MSSSSIRCNLAEWSAEVENILRCSKSHIKFLLHLNWHIWCLNSFKLHWQLCYSVIEVKCEMFFVKFWRIKREFVPKTMKYSHFFCIVLFSAIFVERGNLWVGWVVWGTGRKSVIYIISQNSWSCLQITHTPNFSAMSRGIMRKLS